MSAPLQMEVHGTGGPVVFLHGWALNLAVWRDCAQALGTRHQCVSFDLPGHGRSSWEPQASTFNDQMERIAAALPEGPFALIGWSLGGLFAMALAAHFPTRIRRLVLVATSPRFVAADNWPWGLSLDTMRRFASELATNYRGTVNDFLELQTRGTANAAGTLSELRLALAAQGDATPEALSAGLQILEHADLRDRLTEISAPTLVIGGEYDRITPPGALTALADSLPQGRALIVERAGHAPFLSHSALFDEEVASFLDDHD